MAEQTPATYPTEWLTLPEVADLIGTGISGVRRLIEDDALIGAKRDGVFKVPSAFFLGSEPLSSLRGTIIALHDAGLDPKQSIEWLLTEEATLGNAPIVSLRAGRKSEVRRAARVLG